jgi:hypothetical protein
MAHAQAYVDETDRFVMVCPQCGNIKHVYLNSIKAIRGRKKRNLKVRCTCQSIFSVSLNYRRFYRKQTRLLGSYRNLSNRKEKGEIQVTNLSMSGIGFITVSSNALSVGDKIKLNFTLDDNKQSEIEKSGIVRWIDGFNVGCEFADTSQPDTNLGFYLMP